VVRNAVNRLQFVCPTCSRWVVHLYVPEIACRRCCKLDWSSRHHSSDRAWPPPDPTAAPQAWR
jgi:hypothetical protein